MKRWGPTARANSHSSVRTFQTRLIFVYRPNRAPHGVGKGERVAGRAHGQRGENVRVLREGKINLRRFRFIQAVVLHICDDANNCGRDLRSGQLHLLANRVFVRPEAARHRLVNDDHRRSVQLILRCKDAAPEHRNAQRVKVVRVSAIGLGAR